MIVNGALNGQRFVVKDGGVRLGRSSSNDIHIPDEELSRNHCLFEAVGDSDIRITDLASANGTLVNGKPLGNDPQTLRVGDLITVGATTIRVVGDQTPPEGGAVDLGLGAKKYAPAPKRRSALANALWAVAVLVAAVAIYLVLTAPQEAPAPTPTDLVDAKPQVVEVWYEKVAATLDGIYRYEMTVARDGMLRVVLNDTKENRHPTIQPKALSPQAKTELDEILDYAALKELDREYAGPEPEVPSLESWNLRVVYTTCAHAVKVVNTQEPEAFRSVREKLEAFSNNELGIHAIRFSREKLIEMSEELIAIGKAKWEDRDVQHGNLAGSVAAYKEAIFYLDTVDPKPDCIHAAREGLKTAKEELDKRYGDQRFVVDRAIKLGDWDLAQRELRVLMEIIPDRRDDRNREASAKLIDVEKRMKGNM